MWAKSTVVKQTTYLVIVVFIHDFHQTAVACAYYTLCLQSMMTMYAVILYKRYQLVH